MTLRVKKLLLSVIIILMAAGVCAAASRGISFFCRGRLVPMDTVVRDGRIYVSLDDLARSFPGMIRLDVKNGRVDINPAGNDEAPEVPCMKVPPGAIRGRVLLSVLGVEYPCKNLPVALYVQNRSVSDSDALSAYKCYARGDDGQYALTHGKVRQGRTDSGGNFFLARVPPGNYEITALNLSTGGKSGRFWRKRITIDKSEAPMIILDGGCCYSLD